MQKIPTRVFIIASVAFGAIGLAIVLTAGGPDTPDTTLTEVLRLLFAIVFISLPAFAISVADKYFKK